MIVVGAGLSGLAAADFLKNRDPSLNVIVLEANDRVGGRLLSQKIGDCSFDLGGQWILPEHKNLLQVKFLDFEPIFKACKLLLVHLRPIF